MMLSRTVPTTVMYSTYFGLEKRVLQLQHIHIHVHIAYCVRCPTHESSVMVDC